MSHSIAIVPTNKASRYLQQLCKHWAHRFDVEFDAQHGRASLPLGEAKFTANEHDLTIRCEVPEGGNLDQLQQVVIDHLDRFAFREANLMFDWRKGA